MKKLILISIIISLSYIYAEDINTILMNSTYKLEGYNINKEQVLGTGFIIGKKTYEGSLYYFYVLVTAKHVLDDFYGETAYLHLRHKIDSVNYVKYIWPIKIRDKNEKLWVTHSDSSIDICALYINLPDSFKLFFQNYFLPSEYFANDSILNKIDLHTGDELRCIGFPHGFESNIFGFPILRSGHISSYPLFPSKVIKRILIDMTIFPGNSGSPVYIVNEGIRLINGELNLITYEIIIGILTSLISHSTYTENQNLSIEQKQSLNIGVIVPSIYIKETIDNLPTRDKF